MSATKISHVLIRGLHKILQRQRSQQSRQLRLPVVDCTSLNYSTMPYSIIERGALYSPDYRVYIRMLSMIYLYNLIL